MPGPLPSSTATISVSSRWWAGDQSSRTYNRSSTRLIDENEGPTEKGAEMNRGLPMKQAVSDASGVLEETLVWW